MSKQPSFKRARPVAPSGDQLFGWVKELVELTEQYTEFRRLGTQGDAAARAWLMKTLAEIGIKISLNKPILWLFGSTKSGR